MAETRIQRVRVVCSSVEEDFTEEEEDESGDEAAIDGLTGQEAADAIRARYAARAKTPLKAIRAFCVHCMGDQPKAVAKCTSHDCPLYPMRMGSNPYQARGA